MGTGGWSGIGIDGVAQDQGWERTQAQLPKLPPRSLLASAPSYVGKNPSQACLFFHLYLV